MKFKRQIPKALLPIFIILLLGLIFSTPLNTIAQTPDPTPGNVDSGESITADGFSPAAETVQPIPTLDFTTSVSAFTCINPPVNWQLKSPLPTGAYGVGVASDGEYVYAAGGYNGAPVNQFVRYNPATDQWATLPSLPTAVYDALTIYAQGKIYVMGGYSATDVVNLVQIYNIAANSWSSGAVMPGTRQQMGGGYFNGKIYTVGGFETGIVTSAMNQTWEYTIAANTWAVKANMPAALAGAASGVVNGHLYLIGGRDVAGATLNTNFIYDIAANTWSSGAPIPVAVNYPGSAVYNSRVWVFGGGDPYLTSESLTPMSTTALSYTQVYDPFTNTWQTAPSQLSARSFQGGAVVGHQIVSVGGFGLSATNTVEVLSQNPMKVLIIYADVSTYPSELRRSIMTQAGVGQVDAFNGQTATPSLAQLMFYDVVVAFSNSFYADAIILGDNLALYQDNGGIVVPMVFSWSDSYNISGDWWAVGYTPFNIGTARFVEASLGSFNAGSPLMLGVNHLNALYRTNVTPAPGAVQVATWSDGPALIAFKGRAVGINAYPGDYSDNWSGDFGRVIVNAGNWLWLGNRSCQNLVCNPATEFHGTLTEFDFIQVGRLVRNDPASTCDATTTCSIQSDAIIRNFDQYQFLNNTGSEQCITVSVDTGACVDPSSVQSAAYLGSYNPASQCTNYLADIGASPMPFGAYSFKVPAWQSYTVIVNEVAEEPLCPNYTLTVSASDCVTNTFFTPFILKSTP